MRISRGPLVSAIVIGLFYSVSMLSVHAECWFLRQEKTELRSGSRSFRIGEFLIYAPDINGVYKHQETLKRSMHFLKTELGWKFPYTRKDFNDPVLEIHFVSAGARFTGTVRPGPVVVLNEAILRSPDFPALWMHYLAHAAQTMYRDGTAAPQEYWFYEATAGWMEGQFTTASDATRTAQKSKLTQPGVPLDSMTPELSLGVSSFLEVVTRQSRDVIRQTWEQWSFSGEERVMDTLSRVLRLNHLPQLRSFLLNYYLRASGTPGMNTTNVVLQPYSALVVEGTPEGNASGGLQLSFLPKGASSYSGGLIYFGSAEKEGVLTLKESMQNSWSVPLPFSNMARYRMIIVNSSNEVLRGDITKRFDSTIPAVLEYFRATPDEEGGMQLEWKTSRENGVAFWNLYRVQNGVKERLNALPIPATLDSPTGLNYVFIDHTTGSFYSLEAITAEGFPSPVAITGTWNHN